MKLIRKLKSSIRNIHPEEMEGLRQDNSSHALNEELTKKIENIHDEAASAYKMSQNISKDLQSVVDAADVTIPLIPYMYPHQVEAIMPVWSSVGDQTIHIRQSIEESSADSDALGGIVSLTSVRTSALFSPDNIHSVDLDFKNAIDSFRMFSHRPDLKDEVVQLLVEYGLDEPQFPGEKSSLEQLRIAHEAFSKPVTGSDPVSTSLIPLRECIHSVLDGLASKRPDQEIYRRNQRKKVISIGRQLKVDSLPDDVVNEWADEWHDLNTRDLSGAKRANISREECSNRLYRGTLFLHSLLKGIDPDKFH